MDLGARRHDVACLVHAELSLRVSCVQATDSPRYLWSACLVRPRTSASAKRTASVILFFKSHCHLFCVPRMLSVRCPYTVRAWPVHTDSVHPQFICKNAHTLPNTYVLRTYNARCAHWPLQYIKSEPTGDCITCIFKMTPKKAAKTGQKASTGDAEMRLEV